MNFNFHLPVDIIFGGDSLERLPEIVAKYGACRGVLVCDSFFRTNGLCERVVKIADGAIAAVFSDIRPNPTVDNVDACVKVLRENDADFVVALGGGSTMDCAKAAAAICRTGDSIRDYHTGGKKLDPSKGLPLIAVPTTAGTGSEVTCVAVLSDEEKHVKAPLGNLMLLPKAAVIDYKLTMGIPPKVTASTGIDVLSHALEGFWSVKHQPICDATAVQAAKLVFNYLPIAYADGSNEEAREKMSLAALLAGIAFGHPTTTGSHACSFPLTNRYGVPHGEACAFTLDSFCRINAATDEGRILSFAKFCGFDSIEALADGISELKKKVGLRSTLKEIGVSDDKIAELAQLSMHPNMLNNPVHMTVEMVQEMYERLK
jgi:phosphonate metabolism-associated iron-containing alcohol dehydrogenase